MVHNPLKWPLENWFELREGLTVVQRQSMFKLDTCEWNLTLGSLRPFTLTYCISWARFFNKKWGLIDLLTPFKSLDVAKHSCSALNFFETQIAFSRKFELVLIRNLRAILAPYFSRLFWHHAFSLDLRRQFRKYKAEHLPLHIIASRPPTQLKCQSRLIRHQFQYRNYQTGPSFA